MKRLFSILSAVVVMVSLSGCVDTKVDGMALVKDTSWTGAEDGSLLIFAADSTFLWYRDPTDLTNYYYAGSYRCLVGNGAVEELEKAGVTGSMVQNAADRGSFDAVDVVYLSLEDQICMIDGENVFKEYATTPYWGFYNKEEDQLELKNMSSGNSHVFLRAVEE